MRAAGRIFRIDSAPPRWALLVEALRNTLGTKYCLHEQRRKVEELGPQRFDQAGYYGIRVLAMKEMLVEKGVLSSNQIAERMDLLAKRAGSHD